MKRNLSLSACAIVALAGTSAGAQVIDWAAAVDGNWNLAGNWAGANIPNAIGEDAVIGLAGSYLVSVTNHFNYGSLTVTNPLAVLEIGGSSTTTLNGDLFNDGSISINVPSTIFNTHLSFGVDATISGSGSILLTTLNEPGDAQIVPNGFTVSHANGHTIHGSGQISGIMNNSGDIIADDPAGAGLRLAGTLNQTATGRAGADSGTLLLGNGSVTTGGQLISINGGNIQVQNNATIGAISNFGDLDIPGQAWFLLLNGDVVNNGTITINSDNAIFNAHVRFQTAATVSGTGNVLMKSAAGDIGDAQILTNGAFNGTIGVDQTVEGSGLITGASGGTIVNLGTINGNDAAFGLGLAGNHNGGGIYRSDNGTLLLRNGLNLDAGTFDSSGTGIVRTDHNGISTISNVTNLGQMGIVGEGGVISLTGQLTNDGALTINSNTNIFNAHLRFDTSTSISGLGTIHMVSTGDLGDAQLYTNGIFSGTIGANQIINGSGMIDGRSGGTIINNGVINGNHAAVGKASAISLQLRGNHNGNGVGVYRSDDGILSLGNGLVLQDGIFDSTGAGIVDATTNGIATLSDVTNVGEMGVRGQGGSITLAGPMTNDGNLTLNSDGAVFNAHLRFAADTAINGSGTVTMVSAGNSGDAQLFTDGVFLGTIGASQTIQGSGQVDGRSGGTIINNGTINGNDPVFSLELRGNHTGSGVYRSDDGVLALINGASFDGGTFDSSGAGIVDMVTNGTATLSNMTNAGTLGIRGQGGIVGLAGPLTNNGVILVNSDDAVFNAHLRFLSATTIDGTGTIDMELAGNFGDAQILNDQGFIGTIGAGQTITGSGLVVGEMNMDGTFDPSSTQRQIDVDTLNFSATSGMIADLGGLLAGEFDRLTIGNGSVVSLDGTLTVNLDDGYSPMFGDTWDIVSGGSVSGEFASVIVPEPGIGLVYRVIYEPDRAFVVLTCVADLTGDNVLDFFDIVQFLNFFSSDDVRSDINGDGDFDFFDIALFLQIFSGDCL